MKGSVYIIPTPIGNMADITLRALEVLKEVDALFCEDTREVRKLLEKYNIKASLIINNDFNEEKNVSKLLKLCQTGKKVGIVSDRGTPLISDPGYKLVRVAIENNFPIISLPGPCALITALTLSGFSIDSFVFLGFLDKKKNKRSKQILKTKEYEMPVVIYETPHRVNKILKEMLELLDDQEVFISREISKRFETHYRGKISEVIKNTEKIKGEIVIIIDKMVLEDKYDEKQIKEMVDYFLPKSSNLNMALKKTAHELNISKREVYKKYHNL